MRTTVDFDHLRPGDVVVEADGVPVGPVVVERAADGRNQMELMKPRRAAERLLYRDFAREYLVERLDDPAPVAPPDPAAQLVEGPIRSAVDDDGTLSRLALAVPRVAAVLAPGARQFLPPGGRQLGRAPECGDVVLIASGGFWRAAVVTDIGRKNARVAYATPGGVRTARQSYLRVFRPHVQMTSVYVVTGEAWVQRAIAAV